MKSILVLATDYPDNNGKVSLMYIHTRNIAYKSLGYNVKVLNFTCSKSYVKDGIEVLSLDDYKNKNYNFDILLSHASNIRNHYLFLKKYSNSFEKIIFFYHGHEVLKINKDYCKPYYYMKQNFIKRFIQDIYDYYKLRKWKKYLPKIAYKSKFVFVSKWMLDMFEKNVMKLPNDKYDVHITYNCIGKSFETFKYSSEKEKEYDFITIRSFLDGAKYSVDLVINLAKRFPNFKFCLIGKGKIFEYYEKPDNLIWINENLNHNSIVEYLESSRIALMPTRTDAQGLMACEIASIGMPLITSDIPVCHEIFDDFENVRFINNNLDYNQFELISQQFIKEYTKNEKYYEKNTILKEVSIFEN